MNPASIQAVAAERTREMYAAAAARRHAAEIRRSRRAQRSQPSVSAQRSRRGFRIRHALRAA
jgi:hypothetical protein